DRRAVAENRLHALAPVERVIGLERPRELAILGEKLREAGVVAVVGIAREQKREPAAFALDEQAGQVIHQSSLSCASLSISAKASLARRKLSTAAGMPP